MAEPITHETRRESYDAILPFAGTIREAIFQAVMGRQGPQWGLTAEDAQDAIGCSLNSARSRLTELFKQGRLVVSAKRKNRAKTRFIAVYSIPIPCAPITSLGGAI